MRVVTASGESVDLGTTETAPTIGITDFSRRVTDDFGVTTVVERDFSRRLSVRLAVPFANVDGLQQRLAALRATAAQWIADERFAWLNVQGYYKDFSIDLNTPPVSYCTLTVEGLAENGAYSDPGGDPAPDDKASTLQLLQPVTVDGSVLTSSTVAEADYPEWSASASYAPGARVIKAATHLIYESAAAANVGNDPAGASGKWIVVGATNRWAMFDQALGSATTATGSITVTLNAGAVTGVALLDVIASTVRVRGTGYDRTVPAGAGAVTFLDLPSTIGTVTVTIAGTGKVSVGTLLIGQVVGLGITEASPTAGITDFSRKETDDFGEVTVVPRAWAKRMSANALIRADALDLVASRIAAVRARPSLWIGAAGVDSLTVYGFFKDFSIEAGENVSKLALSIEGLSAAAQLAPLDTSVDWPDVGDPTGTKPADNATNTADPKAPFGDGTVGDVLDGFAYLENTTIPFINAAVEEANARIATARSDADAKIAAANTRIDGARSVADAAKNQADQALIDIENNVTQLNERIDSVSAEGGYNDTAVYAEIKRVEQVGIGADVALGKRIDTVTASVKTTDDAWRAEVSRVETAAANADTAISQRIDSLVAEGTGADGSDSFARSEITRVEQASVTRDNALSTRVDTITTDYKAGDSATQARITQEVTALSNADMALGGRIDSVVSDYQGRDGATNARITTQVDTLAAADAAISRRIDSIVAEGSGGDTDVYARSEISRVETAAISRDDAIGQRVDTVAASFTPGGNWIDNTAFVTADGWTPGGNAGAGEYSVNLAGDNYHPAGENVLGVRQVGRAGGTDSYLQFGSVPIPVQAGTFVQFYAMCGSHRANTTVFVVWLNGAGGSFAATSGGEQASTESAHIDPGSFRRSGVLSVQVPVGAVAAQVLLRKQDTFEGQGDSYAWFWRPYLGLAREGQTQWNPWSPGKGNSVQTGTDARVNQKVTALAEADRAFAERAAAIEASNGQIASRVTATETALTDGRFATAQRVSAVEATANGYSARISATETAVSDGRFAAAQTVNQLRSEYNGTVAVVEQQAGTLTGLGQRTSAYWRVGADAGNGRRQLTVYADANGGGGVDIVGDVAIHGDLVVGGSISTPKIASNAVTSNSAAYLGGMSANGDSGADSPSLTVAPGGGTFIVNAQFEAVRNQNGTGALQVTLWASGPNGNAALKTVTIRQSSLNAGGPVNFWVIDAGRPAGGVVSYWLHADVVQAGGTTLGGFQISSMAIHAMETKR